MRLSSGSDNIGDSIVWKQKEALQMAWSIPVSPMDISFFEAHYIWKMCFSHSIKMLLRFKKTQFLRFFFCKWWLIWSGYSVYCRYFHPLGTFRKFELVKPLFCTILHFLFGHIGHKGNSQVIKSQNAIAKCDNILFYNYTGYSDEHDNESMTKWNFKNQSFPDMAWTFDKSQDTHTKIFGSMLIN